MSPWLAHGTHGTMRRLQSTAGRVLGAGLIIALGLLRSAPAQTPPAPVPTGEIDAVVREAMTADQLPSVSLAVALDGKLAYAQAYGEARRGTKPVPATTATRYGIGSVSKQFCAVAVLLLAEDGKLRLDDPVGKYVPGLTRGDTVTIRQVLNHTSGYRDYWPQDYVPGFMLKPTAAEAILDGWARKPLDFAPGEQWQYSNTNYTVAGLIVERAAGKPFMDFLRQRVFEPLGMKTTTECDTQSLAAPDAAGYTRVGLGPIRPAPKEGAGWLFAAGGLAMTPSDLVRWDLALTQGRVLKPESYRELTTAGRLAGGQSTRYGLGIVSMEDGSRRLRLEHGGEISGTLTQNVVWPAQGVAVAVIVNADWSEAPVELSKKIRALVLPDPPGPDTVAQAFFTALQAGHPDPSAMSENLRGYFTAEARRDAAAGLGPLGPMRTFRKTREEERGGMTLRTYHVGCARGTAEVIARTWPDGKFEQFNVLSAEP